VEGMDYFNPITGCMKERRKILAEDEVMKDLADQQKAILKKEKKN